MKYERINEIEQFLSYKNHATINELLAEFDISIQTLRRDINILHQRGVITKVYGGVIYNKEMIINNTTPVVETRMNLNIDKKKVIGQLASTLIEPNDVLFIDSGTTTIHLIPHIVNKPNLLVVTHGLDVINEVRNSSNIESILIGGKYLPTTNSFYTDTNNINYSFNKAIISTIGLSLPKGLSNENFFEAAIKKYAIHSSSKVIVLIDSTKFDITALNNFSSLEKVHYIVTDEKPNARYLDYFKKNNIKVIYPENQ